eukprot:8668307-Karenia_brevis.AAC.1
MLEEGKMSMDDYNYPLKQFYKYKNIAMMKGAEASPSLVIEYAVELRIEFILAGAETGPIKDIHFKVFKKGTCGVIGAVLGRPTLDHPAAQGGEGLGLRNTVDGVAFTALGVTVPRLDDVKKIGYNVSLA